MLASDLLDRVATLDLEESEPGEVLGIDGSGGTRALAGELFATEAARDAVQAIN
jgi:hypothetical protein